MRRLLTLLCVPALALPPMRAEAASDVCVRIYVTSNGTVVFADDCYTYERGVICAARMVSVPPSTTVRVEVCVPRPRIGS